jgi:hypothetical protein
MSSTHRLASCPSCHRKRVLAQRPASTGVLQPLSRRGTAIGRIPAVVERVALVAEREAHLAQPPFGVDCHAAEIEHSCEVQFVHVVQEIQPAAETGLRRLGVPVCLGGARTGSILLHRGCSWHSHGVLPLTVRHDSIHVSTAASGLHPVLRQGRRWRQHRQTDDTHGQ